jgi:hypothetical protein
MRFVFLILTVTCLSTAHGQNWKIQLGMTYGTYSLRGLKEFQDDLKATVNFVPSKKVETFPAWFGQDLAASRTIRKIEVGTFISYNSTGGRIHYEDYSGEIKFDQLIRAISAGFSFAVIVQENDKYQLRTGLRTGFSFTNLKFRNDVTVGDEVVLRESYTFKSANINFSPLLELEYFIGKLYFSGELRYEFNVVKDPLTLNGDGNIYIPIAGGEKLKADWDGIRITAAIGYKF